VDKLHLPVVNYILFVIGSCTIFFHSGDWWLVKYIPRVQGSLTIVYTDYWQI